ncbi:hypothetical protein ACQJBY_030632 [Aegilops geniculata]
MGRLDRCCTLTAQNFLKRWRCYVFIAFILVVVVTGIVLLVLRFAFKPHVEASIEDARLTSFGGTETPSSSFLEYNISIAISIHNPTWGTIKHTKPLVAAITFHDNSLLKASIAGEGHKYRPSKKEVHLLQESGKVPWDVLGRAALEDFKQENKTGVFTVEVRLSGEITYLGLDNVVTRNKRNLGFSCPLSLQLAPPGHGAILFHEVNCKPDPQNIYF